MYPYIPCKIRINTDESVLVGGTAVADHRLGGEEKGFLTLSLRVQHVVVASLSIAYRNHAVMLLSQMPAKLPPDH